MSDENYIEEKNISPLYTSLIVGGIMGIFMLIYNYIFIWSVDLKDMESTKLWGYLQYLILLGFGLAAIIIHRDKNLGGEISYGQAFLTSFLTILWFSIIVGVVIYFFYKIKPELLDEKVNDILKAIDKKRDRGDMTDDDFENAKKGILWMNGAMQISIVTFFSCLIPGVITSLVATAFHKLIKPKKA